MLLVKVITLSLIIINYFWRRYP